jgi:TnpA family transposase
MQQQDIKNVVLVEDDLDEIKRCRRAYNRLGLAYQLGFVRLYNRLPQQSPFEVDSELLIYTATQLGENESEINKYKVRQPTISEHQKRIVRHLNLKVFGKSEAKQLGQFVFDEACRLDETRALLARVNEHLWEHRILQPAGFVLDRIIAKQRKQAREHIFKRITADIPESLVRKMDELLVVKRQSRTSGLQLIKANPSKPSVAAMLALVHKIEAIEKTGVIGVQLGWLNTNYQRALFHQVRKSSVMRLRKLADNRRYTALVCFLWQSYRDAVDQAVDMYDKIMTRTQNHAEKELAEYMVRQRRKFQKSLSALKELVQLILDDSVNDADLRQRLFETVSKTELAGYFEGLDEWISGKKSHPFHGVVRRHVNLRKFTPSLLNAIDVIQDTADKKPSCLKALQLLKKMNKDNQRKLPENAPLNFVPKKLKTIVENDGGVDRHAWECALLLKVRDEIKSGNLAVRHSKRFGLLSDYFIGDDRWQSARSDFFLRSGMPYDPVEVPSFLRHKLSTAYRGFQAAAPSNSYAVVDENGWHLSVDKSESLSDQKGLMHLRRWLSANMRKIRLPELLIEVDNDLAFTSRFLAAGKKSSSSPGEICLTLAAVMAHGCNIGPYTMAQLIPGVSYEQLKRVSDWQLTEEAQRKALADVVGAIEGLDTSLYWGEGKTSASDGQRFAMPQKVLQQTYSPKFSDFALEFYSFVADNYAPFYSMPIECTDRDAAFVLDGLLYNESELELEEHYTDTHGYTEINFAAFAMLGRRFCPRIRGVKHQRIYRIGPEADCGPLADLVGRADRVIDTRGIAEQWDRMGQLFASLESGHVAASVALKRLASFSGKNRFYRAVRDLGRVFKTEFILQYMSEPELRGRIRRGLLKVEQLHGLARDVFFGRRGRINARELWEQMNTCSCLTLVVASIVYWQAKEISRIVRECDPEGNSVDIHLLEHVSPIEWENIVLYGQYILDKTLIKQRHTEA